MSGLCNLHLSASFLAGNVEISLATASAYDRDDDVDVHVQRRREKGYQESCDYHVSPPCPASIPRHHKYNHRVRVQQRRLAMINVLANEQGK